MQINLTREQPHNVHFFFNDTPTPKIYTLSLHDALPIYRVPASDKLKKAVRGQALPAGRPSPVLNGPFLHAGVVLFVTSSLLAHAENAAASASTNTPNQDRKSTRLNSSHMSISYAVFCLK